MIELFDSSKSEEEHLEKLKSHDFANGLLKKLGLESSLGISGEATDVEERTKKYGENTKPIPQCKTFMRIFCEQF